MANNYTITACPKCLHKFTLSVEANVHGHYNLAKFYARLQTKLNGKHISREELEIAFEKTANEFCSGCGYPLDEHEELHNYCKPQSGLTPI